MKLSILCFMIVLMLSVATTSSAGMHDIFVALDGLKNAYQNEDHAAFSVQRSNANSAIYAMAFDQRTEKRFEKVVFLFTMAERYREKGNMSTAKKDFDRGLEHLNSLKESYSEQ